MCMGHTSRETRTAKIRRHLSVRRDGRVLYAGGETWWEVNRNPNEPTSSPFAWTAFRDGDIVLDAHTRNELLTSIAKTYGKR